MAKEKLVCGLATWKRVQSLHRFGSLHRRWTFLNNHEKCMKCHEKRNWPSISTLNSPNTFRCVAIRLQMTLRMNYVIWMHSHLIVMTTFNRFFYRIFNIKITSVISLGKLAELYIETKKWTLYGELCWYNIIIVINDWCDWYGHWTTDVNWVVPQSFLVTYYLHCSSERTQKSKSLIAYVIV